MNRAERAGRSPGRTPSNIGWDMNLTAPPTACGNRANNAGYVRVNGAQGLNVSGRVLGFNCSSRRALCLIVQRSW